MLSEEALPSNQPNEEEEVKHGNSKEKMKISNIFMEDTQLESLPLSSKTSPLIKVRSPASEKEKHLLEEDLPIAKRREKRIRIKPLKHWQGERIFYKISEDGLPTPQGVIPGRVESPKSSQKLTKKKNQSVPKVNVKEMSLQPEESVRMGSSEHEREIVHISGSGYVSLNEKRVNFKKSKDGIHSKISVPAQKGFLIENKSKTQNLIFLELSFPPPKG